MCLDDEGIDKDFDGVREAERIIARAKKGLMPRHEYEIVLYLSSLSVVALFSKMRDRYASTVPRDTLLEDFQREAFMMMDITRDDYKTNANSPLSLRQEELLSLFSSLLDVLADQML